MIFLVDMLFIFGLVVGLAMGVFMPSVTNWIRSKIFDKCDH